MSKPRRIPTYTPPPLSFQEQQAIKDVQAPEAGRSVHIDFRTARQRARDAARAAGLVLPESRHNVSTAEERRP